MSYILLTIDLEDWFQVENFKQCIPFSSWPSRELRVEANTHRLLDLLDSQPSRIRGQRSANSPTPNPEPRTQIRATFFILGWIAERLPNLVRKIRACGHEVASHGYYHNLCNQQPPHGLKKDLTESKKVLEDIIGAPVYGYRAPSFAINEDILKVIEDCGYLYDSSYNSFAMHGRYGRLNLSQNGTRRIAIPIAAPRPLTPDPRFYEFPISNLGLGGLVLPWGGGAYFRLIPSPIFTMGVKSILKKQGAYLFYIHPWELDPQQPRVEKATRFFKFRHYVNLNKTSAKLSSFMQEFKECNFATCHQYLKQVSI